MIDKSRVPFSCRTPLCSREVVHTFVAGQIEFTMTAPGRHVDSTKLD